MEAKLEQSPIAIGGELYIRKLNKAGGSRYLSVGKILPLNWEAVKVEVTYPPSGSIVLKLTQIK